MTSRRLTITLASALCLLVFSGWIHARNASITIEDTSPLHIHSPGKLFNLKVKVAYTGSAANVSCHWQDYRGQAIGSPVNLPSGQTISVSSPATTSGYYQLIFKSGASDLTFPNRRAGESREYGFAIIAERSMDQRIPDISRRFGVVQADLKDPYLPTWVKTMTWNTAQKWWRVEMDQRRARKLLELPLASRDVWFSDGNRAISQAALSTLKNKLAGYFQADPETLYWELGIEENLNRSNFTAPHFFANLEKKVKIAREAADAVNPKIKFIYQLVATDVKETVITAFLKSDASKIFDILSLHPYRWPDFPMPDVWMPDFLSNVQTEMQKLNRVMPIWFTEIGAPHNGNPGGFFGFPEAGNSVTGLSRPDAVRYLIQSHVIALDSGVEKIFWYNYIDRDPKREYAEDHFGLKDYWGFPKSAYVAYTQLHLTLEGKQPAGHQLLSGNVRAYRFNGTAANHANEDVLVVWRSGNASDTDSNVGLSTLLSGLSAQRVVSVMNSVGTAQAVDGESVAIGPYPIILPSNSLGTCMQ